jgi:hypothetical protein
MHSKKQKICDRAEVPQYILLTVNEDDGEFELMDSLDINSINKQVAECTDDVQI